MPRDAQPMEEHRVERLLHRHNVTSIAREIKQSAGSDKMTFTLADGSVVSIEAERLHLRIESEAPQMMDPEP